jgi:hypothetical protein
MGWVDTARIYNVEAAPIPFGFAKKTVARRARCIVYDRETFTG